MIKFNQIIYYRNKSITNISNLFVFGQLKFLVACNNLMFLLFNLICKIISFLDSIFIFQVVNLGFQEPNHFLLKIIINIWFFRFLLHGVNTIPVLNHLLRHRRGNGFISVFFDNLKVAGIWVKKLISKWNGTNDLLFRLFLFFLLAS